MSDHERYPPGYGHEWRGDWKGRLLAILRRKGFESVTAFARAHPTVSLDKLASLAGPGDVAPIQLQWQLVEEAHMAKDLRPCALDLLVRFLHEVKRGWPSDLSWDGQRDVRTSLMSWQTSLGEERYEALASKMVLELLRATDLPAGWLPSGTEDPRLVTLFNKHWPLVPQESP